MKKLKIPSIIIAIILCIYGLLVLINSSNEKDREECFKECYVMNMDTCETFDKVTCQGFDRVVRLYCCHECEYKINSWWETEELITKEDI